MLSQHIQVDQQWWNNALGRFGYEPLTKIRWAGISRSDLFELASEMTTDPFPLLWHCVAWGAGSHRRNCLRRIRNASETQHAAVVLLRAAELSHSDPAAAYATLAPRGRPAIKFLGPAFFTKYLYFAGAGSLDHPCVILDANVARGLNSTGDAQLPTYGWSARQYFEVCDLLGSVASTAAAAPNKPVGADQIELALFWAGRR